MATLTHPSTWPPKYTLRQSAPLGSGTYGQVLLVRNNELQRDVAMKITHREPAYRRAALTEVDVMRALLGNPCVARYIDSFEADGHVHLVMDLMAINTYEYLSSTNFHPTPLRIVRSVAESITRALSTMHMAGYMHCDIKPENIMLRRRTNPEDVCLIDFGSARRLHENRYYDIQSLWYRAPEVICGLPYTPAIDVWSVGCVLYELHTGTPLFPAEDAEDAMSCIVALVGKPSQVAMEKGLLAPKLSFSPSTTPGATDCLRVERFCTCDADLQLSDMFLHLLKRMLDPNEQTRITVGEILQHPFIRGCDSGSDYIANASFSSSIKSPTPQMMGEESFALASP